MEKNHIKGKRNIYKPYAKKKLESSKCTRYHITFHTIILIHSLSPTNRSHRGRAQENQRLIWDPTITSILIPRNLREQLDRRASPSRFRFSLTRPTIANGASLWVESAVKGWDEERERKRLVNESREILSGIRVWVILNSPQSFVVHTHFCNTLYHYLSTRGDVERKFYSVFRITFLKPFFFFCHFCSKIFKMPTYYLIRTGFRSMGQNHCGSDSELN